MMKDGIDYEKIKEALKIFQQEGPDPEDIIYCSITTEDDES